MVPFIATLGSWEIGIIAILGMMGRLRNVALVGNVADSQRGVVGNVGPEHRNIRDAGYKVASQCLRCWVAPLRQFY